MKISKGLKEDGIVVGNTYDKYGSKNPIVKWIMAGFDNALVELVKKTAAVEIHEIGCGEGYWVLRWSQERMKSRGCDFSNQVIELARENAKEQNLSPEIFQQKSIYDVEPKRDSAELIICCEVLEHLEHPDDGLRALQKICKKHIILSVPREPIWRLLNMARGKYLTQFGNTPGHIQHWSRSSFIGIVSQYFDVLEVKSPFPWTMLLCRVKN